MIIGSSIIMKAESELVHYIWEHVREAIPSSKRADIALSIVKQFEDFGFDYKELQDLTDEDVDVHLANAYRAVFEFEEEEENDEDLVDLFGDDA